MKTLTITWGDITIKLEDNNSAIRITESSKSSLLREKTCLLCNQQYVPTVGTQKFCQDCGIRNRKEYKRNWKNEKSLVKVQEPVQEITEEEPANEIAEIPPISQELAEAYIERIDKPFMHKAKPKAEPKQPVIKKAPEAQASKTGNIKIKQCVDCLIDYQPTSNVQKRCPKCKDKHNKEYSKNYKADSKTTPAIEEMVKEHIEVYQEVKKIADNAKKIADNAKKIAPQDKTVASDLEPEKQYQRDVDSKGRYIIDPIANF